MQHDALIARALPRMPFLAACEHTPRDDWNSLVVDFNVHLQAQGGAKAGRDPVHCFWSGAPLRRMSILSLTSMVRQGHSVTLHTYGNVEAIQAEVPPGVIVSDASRVVPRALYEHTLATREIRWFSDTFRYAVLYELGGWWLDTDICLIKPLEVASDHVFSSQWSGMEFGHICVGDAMRAPCGSPHMAELYRRSLSRLFNEERADFGAVGPGLLSEYILSDGNEDLLDAILPPVVFNAIDWREAPLFTSSRPEDFRLLADPRVVGVHFWNKMWHDFNLDYDLAPATSIIGYLKNLVLEENWLNTLATTHGSDASDALNQDIGHHYTRIYHNLFRTRALESIRLLVIGLRDERPEHAPQQTVPSLEIWLSYFPNATIIAADNADFGWFSHDRAIIHRIDPEDADQLSLLGDAAGAFDIVIDNGTFGVKHQHQALGSIFPRLSAGGVYAVRSIERADTEVPAAAIPPIREVLYNLGRAGTIRSDVIQSHAARHIEDETAEVRLYDSFRELILHGNFGGLGILIHL